MAEEKKTPPAAPVEPVDKPAWEGSMSSAVPLVGPDGHVHLSKEDIKARDGNS